MLLYVATDAMFELEIEPASVTILLLDTQNQTHNFEQNTVDINCESTPIEVGVLTDLSKPVFYTRGKCLLFRLQKRSESVSVSVYS